MTTQEWDIFKRDQTLENLYFETFRQQPNQQLAIDTLKVAVEALRLGFINLTQDYKSALEVKKSILKRLKEQGVSDRLYEWLDKDLSFVTSVIETFKEKPGKNVQDSTLQHRMPL